MKIAFVHCWITPGGALSVLQDLIDEQDFSEAKVFTLFSDRTELQSNTHKLGIITALPRRVNKLFLFCSTRKIFFLSWLLDYRNLMFFYPILIKRLSYKIKQYHPDHITISSFAIAKNITPVSGVKTTLYLHSPMQYIWSHYDEYKTKLTGIKGKLFRRIAGKLRKRDLKYTKFDTIMANSEYTAKLAEELYGMHKISVSYPHINPLFTQTNIVETPLSYFVYVGRLVNFVRESDVIIHLFNALGLPLIMMGSGPDELHLKSIAKSNIIFVGWISDVSERVKIMSQARGLINLTKESF
ncbi:MAG: glycosyltransferase [bacterium]